MFLVRAIFAIYFSSSIYNIVITWIHLQDVARQYLFSYPTKKKKNKHLDTWVTMISIFIMNTYTRCESFIESIFLWFNSVIIFRNLVTRLERKCVYVCAWWWCCVYVSANANNTQNQHQLKNRWLSLHLKVKTVNIFIH